MRLELKDTSIVAGVKGSQSLGAFSSFTVSSFILAKRNSERFPADFMFQLTRDEFESLRSQSVISKRGGRRHLPYAFTEHGALMAANILNGKRAIQASVQVVRAFIKLRKILTSNAELARKVSELGRKYDSQFRVVFDAIRHLMTPPPMPRKQIGFTKATKK